MRAKFGGLIRQLSETDRNFYKTHSDDELQIQARNTYQLMINSRYGINSTKTQIDENFSKHTKTEAFFYGGNLSLLPIGG